ncbi:MAG TPA: glycerate kinase, partial [Desulfohalobiaceae bacterium]|nr:glycerate kinase [Desulfohalobiaceae bacterium]
ETGMINLAETIMKKLSKDVRNLKGGGAAGGLGAGFHTFLGSSLKKGVDLMLEIVDLERHLANADLVISAEGQLDYQTLYGKGPAGVALTAKKYNLPCVLLVGNIKDDLSYELGQIGVSAAFSICPGPMDINEAMNKAFDNTIRTTEQVVRIFFAGPEKGIDYK